MVVQVVYEAFSMSFTEAAALRRGGPTDKALYEKLLAGIEKEKVVQEKLLSIRVRPGQRSIASHESEFIYPTEFDPPELPNSVGGGAPPKREDPPVQPKTPDPNKADLKSKVTVFPATPASPSAFDTRKLGDMLEVEPQVAANGKYIEVRCVAEHVKLLQLDKWGTGLSEMKMPRFSNQAVHGGITQLSGVPTLIGTISPPQEAQKAGAEKRVWFAFITSKIIEVKK